MNRFYFILLISIVFLLLFVHANINEISHSTLSFIGGIGLFQLVISLHSWKNAGYHIFSPYIVFLFTLYIFSFGQSLMYPLGFISERRDLLGFMHINENDIFQSQVLTLIMLNTFHIGALFTNKEKPISTNDFLLEFPFDGSIRLRTIGWILFSISFIPYVVETINNMVESLTFGYGSIFGKERVGIQNIGGFIGDYFIPAVICLFIAYRRDRSKRILLTGFILINIIAILITGGRSNAVILIALMLIIHHWLINPFSKKSIIVGFVLGFFFLQLLSYIAEIRVNANRDKIEKVEFQSNAAIDAIAEMGGTQLCLIKSMELVPSTEDFRYGKSYLYALTTIIPNLGFWSIHPARKNANLGEWLTEKLNSGYGVGFSMCAEAWVNFGYLSPLLFFLWGILLGQILGSFEPAIQKGDIARVAFLLILFWFLLKIPRNSFISAVRALFYYALPIYLFCRKKNHI